MRRKRRTSGETLVETLAAILIAALASILLLQMTVVSVRINEKARQMDEDYRTALSAAESQREGSFAGEDVAIALDSPEKKWNYSVSYYHHQSGELTAYAAQGGGAG
ncbi:hypothetical protein [uncultured Oscillibacter sp.]|uniref:hypothetical protein n=1 Tax=uncultured Oscillibacter sp. TaxID=876091 RepID=UPI0025E2FBA8|nr:hypothetical protein [uncultured Oscillibacter sp.]